MPELTISNTSPLLYLHLVGQLTLLPRLYNEVMIPPAVVAELQAGAARGVDVPIVDSLSWLRVRPLVSETSIPLIMDLGAGEAEVIALGLENPGSRLILDDALARRIAHLHQLQITGTVGLLLKAKRAGLLPAVAPVLQDLRAAGLWLGDSLIAAILRQADEV